LEAVASRAAIRSGVAAEGFILSDQTSARGRKRLVVCLDGTWNKQDDSTNVLQVFHAVREGPTGDGFDQRRYYDQGVGTGVLDGISGGAFGLGLEANVREAMNWLVGNFDDGDEIYIFGFSRGAFTARSLMAFLARVGIPYRGAPLTVNELWDGYVWHGRDDQGTHNWWEKLVGEPPMPFRGVDRLREDTWRKFLPSDDWRRQYKPFRPPEKLNDAEALLQHFSRRPPITFLGIYDTVGSLGIEALAIPGLRGRIASYHNMRLHSIVGRARHALAIDEHRGNFRHTPLMEWVPRGEPPREFRGAIEQRWFLGAHANIGGGYGSNPLATPPLQWVLDGARACGLVHEPLRRALELPPAAAVQHRRDSYHEFHWAYAHLLRAKRAYRVIAPAAVAIGGADGGRPHALRPIGEHVDDAVLAAATATDLDPPYAPPNLVEWARRTGHPAAATLAANAHHRWTGFGVKGGAATIGWALATAVGAGFAPRLFALTWPGAALDVVLVSAAALAVVVDHAESVANHGQALAPDRAGPRAWRDVLFWVRAVAVVAGLLGIGVAGWALLRLEWAALVRAVVPDAGDGQGPLGTLRTVWLVAAAAVPVVLLNVIARPKGPRRTPRAGWFSGWALGLVLVAAPAGLLALRAALGHAFDLAPLPATPDFTPAQAQAGALLLLELVLLCFLQSYHAWVGDPMREAGLGSVRALQRCWTPRAVGERLAAWTAELTRTPMSGDPPDGLDPRQRAVARLSHCVGHTLWRDALGFVPLYTGLFLLGLWLARTEGLCSWLTENPRAWWLLPLAVAACDQLENVLHGAWLRTFAAGRPIGWLTVAPAVAATVAKTAGFLVCIVAVNAMLFAAGWRLLRDAATDGAGWRGALAVVLATALAIGLAGQVLLWLRAWKPAPGPR
jgi:uncharacterized protein (DUF2235 family)